MQQRNVDFDLPVTREQWDQIARRAAALGPKEGGFSLSEDEPEEIRVYMQDREATGLWSNYVSGRDTYGEPRREMARFVFNDGAPFARLQPPIAADEPSITDAQEQAMQAGLEKWVRDKWHFLLRESGVHFERGHIPQS